METNQLCDDVVCAGDFKCHWTNFEQRARYMFPDGTSQSCVGAQVRCGCTFTMRLISNVTYEHPTAATLAILFTTTLVMYFVLRCLFLQQIKICKLFLAPSQTKLSHKTNTLETSPDIILTVNLPVDNGNAFSSSNLIEASPHFVHIPAMNSDKPPTYLQVIQLECSYSDKSPPPTYAECFEKPTVCK